MQIKNLCITDYGINWTIAWTTVQQIQVDDTFCQQSFNHGISLLLFDSKYFVCTKAHDKQYIRDVITTENLTVSRHDLWKRLQLRCHTAMSYELASTVLLSR